MRKIFCLISCGCLLFSGCSFADKSPQVTEINLAETISINEASKPPVENKTIISNIKTDIATKTESKIIIDEKYFYKGLLKTDNERKTYDSLYSAFQSKSNLVEIPAMETSKIKEIYEYVRLDNPQFFYIPKMFNILKTNGIKYNISLKYNSELDENILKETIDKMVLSINKNESEYMKAKYIYKLIVESADYSANNNGIYSMIASGIGSCEGYSELFKYLCDKTGIKSLIVTGNSRDSAHQWNMVEIDDKWYYVDVTWGDPLNSYPNFDYFGLTLEDISKSHKVDRLEVLPIATSNDSNYFVKSGLLIDSTNHSDIYAAFKRAYAIDSSLISLRMSDKAIFDENLKNMDTWIYRALKNVEYTGNHITYNTNEDLYIINIRIF